MKRRSLMKFATVLGLAGRSAVGRAETAIERLELERPNGVAGSRPRSSRFCAGRAPIGPEAAR